LRTTEEKGAYGKEKNFRGRVAAFKHLRDQHGEESWLRAYTLEPDKPRFDS